MKHFVDYLVAAMAPVAFVGHGVGGVHRRRSIGRIETRPKQGRHFLNWTETACYDVDGHVALQGRLRLAAVRRG